MKKIFCGLLLVPLMLLSSVAADASEDLTTLFQREHAFLIGQKESARRAMADAKSNHSARVRKLEAELKALEREVAKTGVKNDELFESVQKMEKRRKDISSRENVLKALYKKAVRELDRVEAEMKFEGPSEREPSIPVDVDAANFKNVSERALHLLRSATEVQETRAHFRNKDGKLVEGPILRFGGIGAQAIEPNGRRVLGPSEDGVLVDVDEDASHGSLTGLYVFEQLKEAAVIKKSPGLIDQVASFTPGLLLLGLFSLVSGLFVVLLKE